MSPIYLTAFWSVVFIFISGFLSASETALFSIPRERITFYKLSKKKNHQWIFSLLHDGQRTLLFILLGNLIVNVTIVGYIHTLLHFFIARNLTLITLFVATGIILLFGEMIPKNIALQNNEFVAYCIAPFLYHLKIICHPILFILEKINTFFLNRFSRYLRKPSPFITRDEFRSSLAESTRDGVLTESEWLLLQRVLNAADIPVSKCITHRSQLPYVTPQDTISEVRALMCEKDQTICCVRAQSNTPQISGLAYLADTLKGDGNRPVQDIVVPAEWVTEGGGIADLVGMMFREKNTDVCVHDEFGAFTGIFSLNNGLYTILEATLSGKPAMQEGRVSQQFDGLTELTVLKDWIPPSLEKQSESVRTLNGLLSAYLGRIPKTGEKFAIDGWNFYIIKSKLNCIESVLIKKKG